MQEQEKHTTGSLDRRLLRSLAVEGARTFTAVRAREITTSWGLTAAHTQVVLQRLIRSGEILRLRKGVYAVAGPMPGSTPAHEFEIAMALVDPAAISHWSAFSYHGLTEQLPRTVFVTTTTEASPPRGPDPGRGFAAAGFTYRFVQVKPERFFGHQRVWVGDARVTITDLERTLIDGLSMPRRVGGFVEALAAFEPAGDRIDLARMIDYALRLDVATAKRVGWALEATGRQPGELEALEAVAIKGYRPLDPSGPRSGRVSRRWMLWENPPGVRVIRAESDGRP